MPRVLAAKVFQKISRVHIAQPIESENGANSDITAIQNASVIFAEEMRSHNFLFLRILAIRVVFEANSMDLRQARKSALGGRRSCCAGRHFAFLQHH
jgi:hypothetical protein